MLERADYVYKILVQHRNDLDQLLGSLAGGIIVSPGAVSYCLSCACGWYFIADVC